MPRCACGYAHAHIPHDCGNSQRPASKQEPLPPRPSNMCAVCPCFFWPCLACWLRAGYKEENYVQAGERHKKKLVEEGLLEAGTSWKETPKALDLMRKAYAESQRTGEPW